MSRKRVTTKMSSYNLSISTGSNETFRCVMSAQKIAYMVAYCMVILVGIIGNSLVLVMFLPCRTELCRRYEVLILYLSFFDLCSSIIAIHEVYEELTCHQHWPFGWFGCKTIYSCYYISINISISILLIITIDRYRCIVTPFKKKYTRNRIHLSVFVAVVVSFLIQWYQFYALQLKTYGFEQNKHCTQKRSRDMYTFPRTVTILLRDFVFIFVFFTTTIKIHHTLSKEKERRRRRALELDDNVEVAGQKRRSNAFQMILIMGCIFSVLVVPYDIWDCTMLISRILPKKYMIHIK